MILRQLFDSETSTYTYLVADPKSGDAALIDPVREKVDRDIALLADLGLTLRYVLDTHVHADHVTGAGELAARTGAVTVAHHLGATCAGLHVGHGDAIKLGDMDIEVLATPGHTDDSVSYRVGGNVFTGDALLIRGTGRADFQNGDAGQLYDSLTKVLFALPDDMVVWPGHDYKGFTSSTIGEEKRLNPRLTGRSRGEFIEIMANLGLPAPRKLAESVPANRRCGKIESAVEVEVQSPPCLSKTAAHPDGFFEIDVSDLSGQPPHRLIDVREPGELLGEADQIPGAELVPLATLESAAVAWSRSEPLILVCRSGRRSARAVHVLRGLGFECTASLRGGMTAYHEQQSRP